MKKCTKKAQKMRNVPIRRVMINHWAIMINHWAIEEKKLATYVIKHPLTFNNRSPLTIIC
ncbi:hypothetical protein NP7_03405 [Moraxella osloensis]|uniref:Uncharacterized protein n=1 Tax=Faucicola osloensis TaxID=34062 RepID=A0A2D2LTP4_FAUOS|nr:hypothetical protein NP7_03405 [Moraxella osloensis]